MLNAIFVEWNHEAETFRWGIFTQNTGFMGIQNYGSGNTGDNATVNLRTLLLYHLLFAPDYFVIISSYLFLLYCHFGKISTRPVK